MKVNTKSAIIAAITFVLFLTGSMLIVNKCTGSSNDIAIDNMAIVGDTLTSEGKVMEFDYQNHKFINIVKCDDNGNAESFVVHDPNCRCSVKKLNNITTVITNNDNHNKLSSDSIVKANFRVVLSKLNSLYNDNVALMKEVKTLRTEVAMLKKMKTNCTYKSIHKKVQPKKRR